MKKYGEQERLEHIENWKKGTLSQTAYAKSAGIIPTTFYTWIREKKGKGFAEIPLQNITENKNEITIEKKGVHVRVSPSANIEELQNICIRQFKG